MSTASNRAQSQTQTQTEAKVRETMSLEPLMADRTMRNGDVVAHSLALDTVSYLEANDEQKSTFGGLVDGFVDPVSGKPCWFTGRDGQTVIGKLPVRFFGDDADFLEENVGQEPASELYLGVKPEALGRVYRKDDGTVSFVALRLADITGEFGWNAKLTMKRKG